MLEAITGCFSQSGGVPELGLGNAEVNVIFNTWMLHLTLCENARRFHRRSVILQWLQWILGTAATLMAVLSSSYGSGVIAMYQGRTGGGSDEQQSEAELSGLLQNLNFATILVPIALALVVTIQSRLGYRDKWSVCIMAADQLASEIYKFRLVTVEYDVVNKPPGKDEDGNDLPPLSQKEKSRKARELLVSRVQAFYSAARTELSQTSSLMRTRVGGARKKPAGETLFVERSNKDDKPTFAQWWKLKLHLEEHFHRTSWAFPVGVSFLSWMSGLKPYLSQKTMREEMKMVIQNLEEDGRLKRDGNKPLSESTSNLIRRSLAQKLGLPPKLFDVVKDELRVLQRNIIVQMAKDDIAAKIAEDASEQGSVKDVEEGTTTMVVGGAQTELASDDDKAEKAREALLDMMGQGKPKADDGEKLMKLKKKAKKVAEKRTNIDDDYLAGPLTIDTYAAYRMRPVMDMLERRANKLSFRLTLIEILGFIIQSSGAILATFEYTEWVAMTVAVAAVLQGFIEFMNLRNQLTSVNIALKDLENVALLWDSLSIVRRRTNIVKMQIAATTENALLSVVEAHTTASSNVIASVAKSLAAAADADEQQEEEAA